MYHESLCGNKNLKKKRPFPLSFITPKYVSPVCNESIYVCIPSTLESPNINAIGILVCVCILNTSDTSSAYGTDQLIKREVSPSSALT